MAAQKRVVPRGQDYLTTIRSDQYIELAPDLLGPNMKVFSEKVAMVGIPLNPPVGNADTIMERGDVASHGKTVKTRLVAFANVSAAPILLEGDSALAGYYDLYATLSPTRESPGEMTFHFETDNGGWFESRAEFWPMFELRPLGGGTSIFIDTGRDKVPGFPMNVGHSGGRWSFTPPTPSAVRGFRTKQMYYEDVVIITASRDGQITAERKMEFAPTELAKCAKAQAEFDAGGEIATFGRPNFGRAMTGANFLLE
ncbi:hypothetical protein EFR00_28375 [Rhizobium sophoriradicis]|uniref:hypothetical protein n=1 Tax=Rhizobium sophoriradicis TaxID=1535245 RepID=UPI00098FF7BE|nr:hypothetical protein [Rhizobium sophoriradicis]RSB86877.1 hypothetical protein EFR00_28375 [Rhizobium sophoriradicis]